GSIRGADDSRLIFGVVEAGRIRGAQGKPLKRPTRIEIAAAAGRIVEAASAIGRIIVGQSGVIPVVAVAGAGRVVKPPIEVDAAEVRSPAIEARGDVQPILIEITGRA